MNIGTDSLKAFIETHRLGSFTKAADKLALSQSALSQKIARLEGLLEATLFIRKPTGIELTSAGEKLLVFAKQQLDMEAEFLKDFNQQNDQLAGVFRLAGFSSVVRSLLIPRLSGWLRDHRSVSVEFSSHEVVDLENILKTNKADAIVVDYYPELPGCEEVKIGEEEYVLIESAKHKDVPNIYLDHGPHDNATDSFFKFQGVKQSYKRGFMGDVYGILDGVALGLGKAVMSKHLVENDKRFKIVPSKKKYVRPIVLCYLKRAYYPPVFNNIIEKLQP